MNANPFITEDNEIIKTHISEVTDSSTSDTCSTISEISEFCADDVLYQYNCQYAKAVWKRIQLQIAHTPTSKIHSIAQEIYKLLDAITTIKEIDSSPLKNLVDEYFEMVPTFCHAECCSFSAHMTQEEKDEELSKLAHQLGDLLPIKKRVVKICCSMRDELEQVKEELTTLEAKKIELECSVQGHEDIMADLEGECSRINGTMLAVSNIPVINNLDIFEVCRMQFLTEGVRNKLLDTKWQPRPFCSVLYSELGQ